MVLWGCHYVTTSVFCQMLPDRHNIHNKFEPNCQIVLSFCKSVYRLFKTLYLKFCFKSMFVFFLRYFNLMLVSLFYNVATSEREALHFCAKCCRTSEIFPSGHVKRKTIISNL